MKNLRQIFLDSENFLLAWLHVARKKGCAGVDGETIAQFGKHESKNLAKLHQSVLESYYQPLPLRQILIPKKNGRIRELRVPTVRDRIVQQALLQILYPVMENEFENSSFAYRPGRSHLMAIRQVAQWRNRGYDWVLEADIVEYFDNIAHPRLLSECQERLNCAWFLSLVQSWIQTGTLTATGILLPTQGIPQGAVISPILANIYLDDFDEIIAQTDLKLVRYADDFLVLSRSRRRIEIAQEEVRQILAQMQLQLHPEKTSLTNFERGFRFLGQVFTQELILPVQPTPRPQLSSPQKTEEVRLIHAEKSNAPTAMELALLESFKTTQQPIPPPLYVLLGYQVRTDQPFAITSTEKSWRNGMSSLYLVQQGVILRKEQGRFILKTSKQPDLEIPIREVERILIYGNVQISTSVIETCLNLQIPVVFLSQLGDYKGHLHSEEALDLDAEMAQFKLRENEEFQIEIARRLVWGKLMNSKQLLLRLNRKRRLPEVATAIERIKSQIDELAAVHDLNALLGYEGSSAAFYFPALGQLLVNPGFSFSLRTRRPPKDPVNSLLSFGYTLLFNNVLSLILAEGLNPYLGNLHRSQEKKAELALDLMEEFRSLVVDSLVVKLVNKQVLKPTDFTWPNQEGGIYLTETARRVFLKNFEERMNESVSHPDVQTRVSYRRAIHLQVQCYKRCLLESVPYEAFLRAV